MRKNRKVLNKLVSKVIVLTTEEFLTVEQATMDPREKISEASCH